MCKMRISNRVPIRIAYVDTAYKSYICLDRSYVYVIDYITDSLDDAFDNTFRRRSYKSPHELFY